MQILSTFCTYNVTKSIRLSKTGRVHSLSITHDIVTALSSLNLRSLASAKEREFCLPKQEVRKTWTSGFLRRLRNLKQRQSFRSPVPLDKGNAGAGGDIETITDHRLQKWETTAFVCYPGPRQNPQYNGADH